MVALCRGGGEEEEGGVTLSGLTLYSDTSLHPFSMQNAAIPSWFPTDSLYPIIYIQLQFSSFYLFFAAFINLCASPVFFFD